MTRRQILLTLSSAGAGAGAVYVWRERRGLTRGDLAASPAVAPIDSLIAYSALAPSGHNAQPWSVRMSEAGDLIIGSDRSRWLPGVDPQNRELALSIGAFLENLLIAGPHHGFAPEYEVTGSEAGSGELVRVKLKSAAAAPSSSLDRLKTRRTLRSGQLARPLSGEDAQALTAHFEGQRAHFVSAASREGRYLAEGTIEANRAQAQRNEAQEELAAWIRFSDSEARAHRDGLTPESMEISGFAGWYVRHFLDRAAVMSESFRTQGVDRVREQVASCGGWIVVTSPDGTLPSLIETGRRLERMWLSLRERSIAMHPMTQMLEEAPFRDRLAKDLGVAAPVQFLLRVGYVDRYPASVSLRRPVSLTAAAAQPGAAALRWSPADDGLPPDTRPQPPCARPAPRA